MSSFNFSIILSFYFINLLHKGLPTKLNIYALDYIISKASFLVLDKEKEGEIALKTEDLEEEIKELLFRSLHIIDPRITPEDLKDNYRQSWENLGSDYEEDFLFSNCLKPLPNSKVPFLNSLLSILCSKNLSQNVS